jgi:predicted phage-related endonuclease
LLPEADDNEKLRQGRDMEEYVSSRFAEITGFKLRRPSHMLASDTHEFMAANLDRDIVGQSAFAEMKTTTQFSLKKFKDGNFPESYYVQTVHGLVVTGHDRAYVAVLVLGHSFRIYRLTRIKDDPPEPWLESSVYVDDTEINALVDAEREFWRHVVDGTPPEPDGSDATRRALDAMYPEQADNDAVQLTGADELISERAALNGLIKQHEARVKEINNVLISKLSGFTRGLSANNEITYNTVNRKECVVAASSYRQLRVKSTARGTGNDSTVIV